MNSLSWFLYFASVVTNITGFLFFVTVSSFIVISGSLAIIAGTSTDSWNTEEENKLIRERQKNLPKYFRWYLLPLFVGFFITLLPSKETMYLIAGSEAVEAVVTSSEGQEIINDIHQVIKHQLEQLKGGTNK